MRRLGGEAGGRQRAPPAAEATSFSGRTSLPPPLHRSRRCVSNRLGVALSPPIATRPPPMLRRAADGGGRAAARALPSAAAAAAAAAEPNRIVEYLEGRTLLVTGATGFLAKARAKAGPPAGGARPLPRCVGARC
jgi:hypothetical protein